MNAIVTAKMDGAVAKISVTADVYLAGTNELKGQLTYNFDIGADAQKRMLCGILHGKGNNASAAETGLLNFCCPALLTRCLGSVIAGGQNIPPMH